MPIGILFWVLMVLLVVLGWWTGHSTWGTPAFYGVAGGGLILLALLFLLGWKVFGFIIQGTITPPLLW